MTADKKDQGKESPKQEKPQVAPAKKPSATKWLKEKLQSKKKALKDEDPNIYPLW
jgi:hypothetical protein